MLLPTKFRHLTYNRSEVLNERTNKEIRSKTTILFGYATAAMNKIKYMFVAFILFYFTWRTALVATCKPYLKFSCCKGLWSRWTPKFDSMCDIYIYPIFSNVHVLLMTILVVTLTSRLHGCWLRHVFLFSFSCLFVIYFHTCSNYCCSVLCLSGMRIYSADEVRRLREIVWYWQVLHREKSTTQYWRWPSVLSATTEL